MVRSTSSSRSSGACKRWRRCRLSGNTAETLELFDAAFRWTVANVTVRSQVSDKPALLAAHAAVQEEYDWFVTALDERRARP